jgi:type IV secretory pathway VirB6-like protein
MIGTDTTTQMLSTIKTSLSQSGPGIAAFTQPYLLFAYSFIQIMLAILSGLVSVIIAYGAIGSTVVGLLGPVFIPFLVIEKLDWLFWGWLKGFLGFAFYKVVAAAVLSVLGQLYMKYYASLVDFTNPLNMLKNVPLLVILLIVNAYMLLKIPALTATLFSGSTGGHDAGTGIATALMMKG